VENLDVLKVIYNSTKQYLFLSQFQLTALAQPNISFLCDWHPRLLSLLVAFLRKNKI